jgi:hypothetical protein
MATISKLKAGQVLWDKHKYKMGNTTMTTWGLWQVNVIEVDADGQWIFASWNGNKPKRMYSNEVKSLKVKEPKMPESRW